MRLDTRACASPMYLCIDVGGKAGTDIGWVLSPVGMYFCAGYWLYAPSF